ncbi:hypothetical protein FRC10_011653 [Ceratobasidium sp. 414]|nr:hypothetical protein FRC10_011653 [Ceratobasidium sp. 414]
MSSSREELSSSDVTPQGVRPNSETPSASTPTPQTLPADILIPIFRIRSTSRTELYAPLIYSHVCAHWRRVVIEAPLLWSYIDTSRGKALTRLWLSRSKNVSLDVRLWENPLECDLMQHVGERLTQLKVAPKSDTTIQDVKDESHRWRSLDIAFCTMRRIDQTLEFLGDPYDTLHLDSLTIGPMGSTTLIPDEGIVGRSPTAAPLMTTDDTQAFFQNLNVRCQVLRIDTYPVCISPVLFSPRLTVLEIFSGSYYNHTLNVKEWGQILSLTPNLVHLRLASFRHRLFDDVANPSAAECGPIQLPALERLELSGAFILIIDLFEKSRYPKLEYLLLDALDATGRIPQRLAMITERSPSLRRLSISCTDVRMWSGGYRLFSLLRELTLFEMGWSDARAVMDSFSGFKNLKRIRLERIWDLELDSPMLCHTDLYELPPIELINCSSTAIHQCRSDRSCDEESNFSENSAFSRIDGEFPSSEESNSDESARSYGEDEDSPRGTLLW